MYSRKSNTDTSLATCGCYVLFIVLNLALGGWSVNYLLDFFVSKTIPFLWATVVGLFIGEFSIPAAIVVKILAFFGIL